MRTGLAQGPGEAAFQPPRSSGFQARRLESRRSGLPHAPTISNHDEQMRPESTWGDRKLVKPADQAAIFRPLREVTQLLEQVARGQRQASAELLPLVYEELRRLAAASLGREAAGHTLQPTALVHEAYLRLVQVPQPQDWDGRGHFFAAAAEAMRRILVENARRKLRLKRGGDLERVNLADLDVAEAASDEQVVAVSEALERLAAHDPEAAELIKLRFFTGLPNVEAAALLKIPERTAKRRWAYARAWLLEELKGGQ